MYLSVPFVIKLWRMLWKIRSRKKDLKEQLNLGLYASQKWKKDQMHFLNQRKSKHCIWPPDQASQFNVKLFWLIKVILNFWKQLKRTKNSTLGNDDFICVWVVKAITLCPRATLLSPKMHFWRPTPPCNTYLGEHLTKFQQNPLGCYG